MKVKNNYNECLTNLACSIRKYFGLDYDHNTINYIDEILEKKQPKNVVTILCDGMGSNIIDRILEKDDFLIKHRLKKITTVFPATTVAATTAIITGNNPCETGMLGWDMYSKELDKTFVTFFGSLQGDETYTPVPEIVEYINKNMKRKVITKEINEKTNYKGYRLFPFGEGEYSSIEEMDQRIIDLCNSDGKKYIYAYDQEPDHSMHVLGCDSKEVIDYIKSINKRIEELSKVLKDTIIFVIADHGHINIENFILEDYPEICECLDKSPSIEPRATAYFVKEDKKEQFVNLFNNNFSEYYDLYTKEDVIASKLFGNGEENPIFADSLGDYLAIAKSNKIIISKTHELYKSHHAGYTDDEIYIPLIVIDTDNL